MDELIRAVEEALRLGVTRCGRGAAHFAHAGSRNSGGNMRSRWRKNWRSSNARMPVMDDYDLLLTVARKEVIQ